MTKRKEPDFHDKIYSCADWVSVYEVEGVTPEVVLGGEKVQAVLLAAPVRLGPAPED